MCRSLSSALVPADGSYGGPSEHLSLTIDVSTWRGGQHLLTLAATDVAGRTAAPVSVSVDVGPSDLVLADGFETGTTARWSRAYGGSRLQPTATDVLVGRVALRATITGNTPSYVQTDSPASESNYRARFWFDPNGTRTRNAGHDVLTGLTGSGSLAFHVVYRRTSSGTLELRAAAARAGGQSWTPWTPITDAPHSVEIAWSAGSAGAATLWVDGVQRGARDPALQPVHEARVRAARSELRAQLGQLRRRDLRRLRVHAGHPHRRVAGPCRPGRPRRWQRRSREPRVALTHTEI